MYGGTDCGTNRTPSGLTPKKEKAQHRGKARIPNVVLTDCLIGAKVSM